MIEYKTFVNHHGVEDKYPWLWMSHHLTGHLHAGSAMETDSDCGNCDGGRCDTCRSCWTVTEYAEPVPHIDPDWGYDYDECKVLGYRNFDSEDEAVRYFEKLKSA